MILRARSAAVTFAAATILLAVPAFGQGLTLPPDGDNQRATVTQQVGPVRVTIDYSSPRVHFQGQERRGKIWGQLVPYGLSDLGFNNCTKCPWRAGANENTVFTVSRDVKVQGQPLPAGSYGLHMIPGKEEWTVIFSRNSTSWGSFFYDPKEDALRVTAKPLPGDYHEWLMYEFTEREPARATVALKWEDLQVPIAITVDDAPRLYVEELRNELRGSPGFFADNWRLAADYCLRNKADLPQGLAWAEKAVKDPFVGQENFQTLSELSLLQEANGKMAEGRKTLEAALAHPTAQPIAIHTLGRQLLAAGKKEEALHVFEANARRFPNQWPVHVGLARGYSATGDLKKALEEARLALAQAPDEGNRKNLQNIIKTLEAGKAID